MADDADGFKIAAGYVEIRLKDSTQADYDAIKARVQAAGPIELRTALGAPDTAAVDAVREALRRQDPVELRTSLATPDPTQVEEVETRLAAQPPVELPTVLGAPDEQAVDRVRTDVAAEPPIEVRATIDPRDLEASYQRARDAVTAAGESDPVDVPTVAADPITDAWRAQVNAAVRATALDAVRVGADPDLAGYRTELDAALREIAEATRQDIPADLADADRFRASVLELAQEVSREAHAQVQVDIDPGSLAKAEAQIAALKAEADDASGGGGGLGHYGAVYTAIGAGAGLGSGALEGAALGGEAAAITAIGVAAEAADPQVSSAFSSMKTAAKSALAEGFQPYIPTLVQIAGEAKSTVQGLTPEFQAAARATAPLLETVSTGLEHSVQDGVSAAVPQLQRLGPVAAAIGGDFDKLEQGVTGALAKIDPGTAAKGLSELGDVTQTLIPDAAGLLNEIGPLGNSLLGVLVPALHNTISTAEALAPVLTGAGDVISFLGPDISALAPPLAIAAVGTKLLTGSWTDGAGAVQKLIGPVQNWQATLSAVGSRLGYTSAAQAAATRATLEDAAAKTALVAAADKEAFSEAAATAATDGTATSALAASEAQDKAAASAAAAAAAEEELAAAATEAEFSFGPLGIALGAASLLALPLVANFAQASDQTVKMAGDLQKLEQAAADTRSLANLFQTNPEIEQQLQQLQKYGVTLQDLTAAADGNAAAQQKIASAAKQAQQATQAKVDADQKELDALKDTGTTVGENGQAYQTNSAEIDAATAKLKADTAARDIANGTYKDAKSAVDALNAAQAGGRSASTDWTQAINAAGAAVRAHGGDLQATTQQVYNFERAQSAAATVTEQFYKAQVNAAAGFVQAQDQFQQLDQASAQASEQVQQASQAVADAHHSEQQAAEAVTTAEQGVVSAQQQVVQAHNAAANAITGVSTAEANYTSALRGEQQAQQALIQARQQAQQQLDDLQRQVVDQTATEESAELRLAQAQQAVKDAGLENTNLQLTDLYNLKNVNTANLQQYQLLLDLQDAQNNLNDTMAQGTTVRQQQSQAEAEGVDGNAGVISAQQQLVQSQQQIAAAAQQIVQAQQQQQQAQQQLTAAEEAVTKAAQGVSDAQYNEQKSHESTASAVYNEHQAQLAATQAKDAASRSTDINTDAGNRNVQTLISLYDQQIAAGQSTDQATASVEAEGEKLGFTKGAVDGVIASIKAVPNSVTFGVVGTPSLDISQLVQTAFAQGINPDSLGFTQQQVANAINPGGLGLHDGATGHARAAGGPIPGVGGPTEDNIPVLASAGEWYHPVSAVDYYGPDFMRAIQTRAIRREDLPQFASGGQVGKAIMGTNLRLAGWESMVGTVGQTLSGLGYKGLPTLPPPPPVAVLPTGGGVSATPTGVPSSRAANEAAVQAVWSQYGWGAGPEWAATTALLMQESGFNNTAQNPTSTAYGMFQFLNSTWAGYGVPKTSDPTQQSVAGARYIKARYGDPIGAEAHELRYHWFDQGGYVPMGLSGIANLTGRPEMMLPPKLGDTLEAIHAAVQGGGRGAPAAAAPGTQVAIHHHWTMPPPMSVQQAAAAMSAQTLWDLQAARS